MLSNIGLALVSAVRKQLQLGVGALRYCRWALLRYRPTRFICTDAGMSRWHVR
jgi:hypothetical protein